MSYSILEIVLSCILLMYLLLIMFIAVKVINSNIENSLKLILIALLLFVPVIGLIINIAVLIKRNEFTDK